MPATARVLKELFTNHLHFTPTAGQIDDFTHDLGLVSHSLMYACLKEMQGAQTLRGHPTRVARNEILKIYARKIAEHHQLFPLLHSFESAFRSTAASRLEDRYGLVKWWDSLYRDARRGADTVSTINGVSLSSDARNAIRGIFFYIDGQTLSRNQVPSYSDGYQLLNECSLRKLGSLYLAHWDAFPEIRLSRTVFEGKFDLIEKARNNVYHHRSFGDMKKVAQTAEELLDYLNFSLASANASICAARVRPIAFQVRPEQRHRVWPEC